MTRIFSNNAKNLKSSVQNGTGISLFTVMMRVSPNDLSHNDVIRDEIRVIAPHMLN